MNVLGFPNVQQPIVQPSSGVGTTAWLAFLRDLQVGLNALMVSIEAAEADIAALETRVDGIDGGTSGVVASGKRVWPLGGGDVACVSNPSLVWMTVKNPSRVRVTWADWTTAYVYAFLQVHSDVASVPATARVVAVDDDGAVTRVAATGTAAVSTGAHASGWSPLERVELEAGSGVEDLVLQVYTSQAAQLVSATGYLEAGEPRPSSSPSASVSSSPSASASDSPSASVSASPSTSPSSSSS